MKCRIWTICSTNFSDKIASIKKKLNAKITIPSRQLSRKTLPYVLQAPQTSPGDVRTNLPTQTVVAQPVYRQQLLGRPGRITVHLYCPGHAQSYADC